MVKTYVQTLHPPDLKTLRSQEEKKDNVHLSIAVME